MEREIKIGQKYKHFKGGNYEVVEIALDCEDPKIERVIYKSLYETPEHPIGTVWAREKNNFLEEITRDGKTFLRFEEI
jgi:hypothetical protein